MLLHLIKLLLEFLATVYIIVITGYAIKNNVIIKLRYKGVGNSKTANEAFLVLAELINKEKRRYRRVNAALQSSHKNTSLEINSNIVEQPFNSGNTTWKRKQKQFPLLKTGNSFVGYPKLFAITKSFTKNHIIDFAQSFKHKMFKLIFLKNYKAII